MISMASLFLAIQAAVASSAYFDGAILSLKSEISGWAIPLFTDPAKKQNPQWFSLEHMSSIFVVPPIGSCQCGIACRRNDIYPRKLFLEDGSSVGQPSVSERYVSDTVEYRDVCGMMGFSPRGPLLNRGALYIHGVDSTSFLLKPMDSDTSLGEDRANRDRWVSHGKLVRHKSGRVHELARDGSIIEINLLSDDVILPWRSRSLFTRRKTKLGVTIHNKRLYLPCKRFDSLTNIVYDLTLQVGGQEVPVPVKKSPGHSKIKDNVVFFIHSDLCATNVIFHHDEWASIGRSVLDHHDVILGRSGTVRFIPFHSMQRRYLEQRIHYEPPRLLRFRLEDNSLQVFDGNPIRHVYRFSPSKSTEWAEDDFLVNILQDDEGVVEQIQLRCVVDCPQSILEFLRSLSSNWYGSPRFELSGEGDLVFSEVMGNSRYQHSFETNYYKITIKFKCIGRRFLLNEERTIRGQVVYLSATSGPIDERNELVVEWPLRKDTYGSLPIRPASRSHFREGFSTVLYGKPLFRPTADGDIEIIATRTTQGLVYRVEFKANFIEVDSPRGRWHQVLWDEDGRATSFNFEPLMTGEISENEFSLYSISDAELVGDVGRYEFWVHAVPNSAFRENPFTLPSHGGSWIGDPVVTTDRQTGRISIKPVGEGLEYEVMTQRSAKVAKLFFVAKNAHRFVVPQDADIANGSPVAFYPVTGLPVVGEFIFSIGSLDLALETLWSGALRMTFHKVLFHHIEVAYMEHISRLFRASHSGYWIGKPELVLTPEGLLQLQAIPGDTTRYFFQVTEDWETRKVFLDFKPVA